jgi:hypothetical protein
VLQNGWFNTALYLRVLNVYDKFQQRHFSKNRLLLLRANHPDNLEDIQFLLSVHRKGHSTLVCNCHHRIPIFSSISPYPESAKVSLQKYPLRKRDPAALDRDDDAPDRVDDAPDRVDDAPDRVDDAALDRVDDAALDRVDDAALDRVDAALTELIELTEGTILTSKFSIEMV